jgi:hypothetical protein
MSESCLFCDQPEKSCKPSHTVDFICGSCVQLLLSADQDELKRAYEKALTKANIRKARAIKTFMVEESHAETEKPERDLVRERAMQAFRPSRDQVRA